ncbi:MAG: LEA type 2 family protein [Phycisphaerales bacterium]
MRITSRHRLLLLGGIAAASLGGCTSITRPGVRVADARVTDRTAEGVVVEVTLEAENRNQTELPLREVRYAVDVDGRRVFDAMRSPEATLRRVGTQLVRFPAVIPASAGPIGPQTRVRITGNLRYQAPGEISRLLYDTGVRRPSIGFAHEARMEELER